MINNTLIHYLRPLLRRFWDICLLRKGPEDVPASSVLLLILIITGLVLNGFRLNLLLPAIPAYALLITLPVYTLLMIVVVAAFMLLLGYQRRIVQTLTAMSGSGILLSTIILPFDYIISFAPDRFTMVSLIVLVMQLWSLVVLGHILTRALSVHQLMGVIIAFGYLMLGAGVFDYLLPRPV